MSSRSGRGRPRRAGRLAESEALRTGTGEQEDTYFMSELHPTPAPRWAQVAPAETPSLRSLTTLAGSVVIVAALYLGARCSFQSH